MNNSANNSFLISFSFGFCDVRLQWWPKIINSLLYREYKFYFLFRLKNKYGGGNWHCTLRMTIKHTNNNPEFRNALPALFLKQHFYLRFASLPAIMLIMNNRMA